MTSRFIGVALLGTAIVAAAGCVAQPPRARYGYDDSYYQRRAQYDCSHRCGVIRDVDRVYVRENSTTGGGAVLGAIIGGVLGSTIGHGDGRTAATVAGAVAGGFAGNAVERNNNDGGGREAWQFFVRLDDGRSATVTQWDNANLRPGDRVMIRDNRLMLLR
jgi:outer membrane lipoprotein SlyB